MPSFKGFESLLGVQKVINDLAYSPQFSLRGKDLTAAIPSTNNIALAAGSVDKASDSSIRWFLERPWILVLSHHLVKIVPTGRRLGKQDCFFC